MKYRDLIQFESVTEVIQLLKANERETATKLVETYVISDRMADVILHRILPGLDLSENARGRGLFIVGNYGTGKSHLMAVLSAIAEHADLMDLIKHASTKEGFELIAGKFKVIRQETSATKMALRDVVLTDLERQLNELGVKYHFKSMDETVSNKLLLAEMMQVFSSVYPEQGLLIVLDELLDYLKARDEKEIILDLNFLRELGETCETLPIRFIAGIQEALFDNPRFAFVADSIKRVKSRFDQASIVREDIAYVVSHRLLRKTDQQQAWIRKHLEAFTKLYSNMAERLDDFVEMFPVHPTYLYVFEKVSVGERRDLLKSLSMEMSNLLEKEVPKEEPGLITFDSYWRMMCEDDAFRTIPDVRNVQDKAKVLSDKVNYASETKEFKETALKIIDGLALHRLTVSDIYAPIGITPLELKDDLCVYLPLPEMDADFLLATIETILKAISTAVNGQFISHNQENDQYYLDLKKDIDFEALIQQKASTLAPSTLDRYYFDVVKTLMEITEGSYVSGFRIWEREIPWEGHGITRRGYLFLGASNERSTAHPERDFYIHFRGLYGNGHKEDNSKADEVFYKTENIDEAFLDTLRLFAGATEMSSISSGSNRDQYDRKANDYKRVLLRWMNDNFIRNYKVKYLQKEMSLTEVIAEKHLSVRDLPFRDIVYKLSGALLKPHFEQKFAHYPNFEGIDLTSSTLYSAADQATRAVSGGPISRLGQAVLEGLQLGIVEGNRVRWKIDESPYAQYYTQLVSQLEAGKVINRLTLFDGEAGAERDKQFGLEPEFVAVILAALIRHGIIAINYHGIQINEISESNGERLSLDQLLSFTSFGKPKPIPELAVRELFSGLNLSPELLDNPATRDLGMRQLQEKLQDELNKVVRMQDTLREGPRFAQKMILKTEEQTTYRTALEKYHAFLDKFTGLTSYARLANLTEGVGEIKAGFKGQTAIDDLGNINESLNSIRSYWEYVSEAKKMLPADDAWRLEEEDAEAFVLDVLADPKKRIAPNSMQQLRARFENLQVAYTTHYLKLHQAARLDREQDARKQALTGDPRWVKLRLLSKLSLLPSGELFKVQDRLKALRACPNLQISDLKFAVSCPYCGFVPIQEQTLEVKGIDLDAIRQELDTLEEKWVDVLVSNLETTEAKKNLQLLEPKERKAVESFLQLRRLPETMTEKLIEGIEHTLEGLEVIEVDGAEYLLAITAPGMPCTPDELEKRIREFLQKKMAGKDRDKLRIQINW